MYPGGTLASVFNPSTLLDLWPTATDYADAKGEVAPFIWLAKKSSAESYFESRLSLGLRVSQKKLKNTDIKNDSQRSTQSRGRNLWCEKSYPNWRKNGSPAQSFFFLLNRRCPIKSKRGKEELWLNRRTCKRLAGTDKEWDKQSTRGADRMRLLVARSISHQSVWSQGSGKSLLGEVLQLLAT